MKLKIGKAYRVTFLDHCLLKGTLNEKPCVFQVRGVLVEKTKKHITLAAWHNVDGSVDVNTEGYLVLTSAIKDVTVIP